MRLHRVLFTALALVPTTLVAHADRITLVDGTELKDVEIQLESLQTVTYEEDGDETSVASHKVRSVEFDRYPPLVDEALSALRGGDAALAVDLLDAYIEEAGDRGGRRGFKWAPPFAAWTAIELRQQFGDLAGVTSGSAAFLTKFPDSRYVPYVYLTKASAEGVLGQASKVTQTLGAFRALIGEKDLSSRWDFEVDLAEARAAGGSLATQRAALEEIVSKAKAEHPGVASRAQVAIGEAILAEAEKKQGSDKDKAATLRREAQSMFEEIVGDATSDDATLAGAYTGLGECYFYAGADAQDPELLKKAVLALLRLPVSYETQTAYVPKALFLAGRSFDMLQDNGRKSAMLRQLEQQYPNNPWTEQGRKFLR